MPAPQADLAEVLERYGFKSVNEQKPDGWTALMEAVIVSDRLGVATLIANGADLEIKDEDGRTALYIAVEYAVTDMTKMLLENGADRSVKNSEGYTPLACAQFCAGVYEGTSTGKFYADIVNLLEVMPDKLKKEPVAPKHRAAPRIKHWKI